MAKTLVLKFGGSSVGTAERIQRVAKIIAAHRKQTPEVVVVVSAMGQSTDELIDLAKQVSPSAQKLSHRREMDMLLTSGERISMALLSMALGDLEVPAISLTGSQSGIITDTAFGEATIKEIKPIRIFDNLKLGKVVIVAGFQGVSEEKEITTLGRGGSDTSAVALGVALNADETIIYTDVNGFYSADPRIVKGAKALAEIPWQLAIQGALRGAQVMHPRSVELAWKHKMPVRVCSSFIDEKDFARANAGGTLIRGEVGEGVYMKHLESGQVMSVSLQKNLNLLTIEKTTQTESALAQAMQMGFRPLYLTSEFSKPPCLRLLIEDDQSEFTNALQFISQTKSLFRLSMVGVAMNRMKDLQKDVGALIVEHKVSVVEQELDPTCLSILFSEPSQDIAEKLLNSVHKKFTK